MKVKSGLRPAVGPGYFVLAGTNTTGRPGNQGAAARPRWLLPGHGDTQPFLAVDEVVVVVSTDVTCAQLILPVNRLSLAV